MGVLGKLFGSDKVIDGIVKTGDALILTNEERLDWHAKFLKLYEPFKIAQRLLAMTFGIPYAIAWVITFIASFFVDDVSAQMALLSGDMGTIVMVIVGFYFGGGMIESFVSRKQ